MFAKCFYEFVNVSACDLNSGREGPADFFGNAWFVPSLLDQLEDSRTDNVEREHLTVPDIEKDSSIRGSCASN